MTWVAGVDGFKRGWRVVLCEIETDTWLMRDVASFRSGVPATFLDEMLRKLPSTRDDFLDACAAAWTARRVLSSAAERLLKNVVRDGRGLDMAMWF